MASQLHLGHTAAGIILFVFTGGSCVLSVGILFMHFHKKKTSQGVGPDWPSNYSRTYVLYYITKILQGKNIPKQLSCTRCTSFWYKSTFLDFSGNRTAPNTSIIRTLSILDAPPGFVCQCHTSTYLAFFYWLKYILNFF